MHFNLSRESYNAILRLSRSLWDHKKLNFNPSEQSLYDIHNQMRIDNEESNLSEPYEPRSTLHKAFYPFADFN